MIYQSLSRVSSFVVAIIFVFIGTAFAEDIKEIDIKTPTVQCSMCKNTIENTLNELDGIISVNLDVDKKSAKVKYDSKQLSPDDIRKEISNAGYDADNIKANNKAYMKLPNCCKLPKDR